MGLYRRFALFAVNHLFSGTGSYEIKRFLLNSAGHSVGTGTKIVGPVFITGKADIGSDCWIGRNFTIHGNGTVKIGDRCDIAPEVMFLTGTHEIGGPERRAGNGKNGEISVGSGCWIGARATILSGADIGSGAVIAACACVTADVPDNVLTGGVPAKTIRPL